jgi:DNA-binding beta-propeller fold protein YncE
VLNRFAVGTLCALSISIGGCGGPGAPGVPAGAAGEFRPAARPVTSSAKPAFLYIGSQLLSQYEIGSAEPVRSVKAHGQIVGPMTLDHSGRLIATDGISGVSVWDARTLALLNTVNATYPTSVAVDAYDDIYVANCGGSVGIFSPGGGRQIGAIGDKAGGACLVAADRSGNIYVVDAYRLIEVYAPGKRPGTVRLLRSLRQGLSNPYAMAFGPTGDAYVANYPIYQKTGSVVVFGPNSRIPKLTITDGIANPEGIAVDSKGTLYVASDQNSWHHHDGWFTVYAPGSGKVLHRVRRSINGPLSLTVDSADNLYVANAYGNNVSVYGSSGTTLLRRIKKGVDGFGDLNQMTVGI